jgi:VIT1/CCC1 family predicted Fe2+/Mn2+ transporter
VIAALAPAPLLGLLVCGGSLFFLAALGVIGARTGGAPIWRATIRVVFWGALAMATTALIGHLVGRAV